MPGSILGLEIGTKAVTAVRIQSRTRGYDISHCLRVPLEKGTGADAVLTRLAGDGTLRADTCIVSLPANNFCFRHLKLPFTENKKIRQALPFEIEPLLAQPINTVVVDINLLADENESRIMAACADKVRLSNWLQLLQRHSVNPEVVDVQAVPTAAWLLRDDRAPASGLLLELGETEIHLVLFLARRIALVRTLPAGPAADESRATEDYFQSLAKQVQNTLHAFEWHQGSHISFAKIFFNGPGALHSTAETFLSRFLQAPAQAFDISRDERVRRPPEGLAWSPALMNGALALALSNAKDREGFNFRKNEFDLKDRRSGVKRTIRKLLIFLIITGSLLTVDLLLDYYFLQRRYSRLNQAVSTVFQRTFPGIDRIVDPVRQAKVRLRQIRQSQTPMPGGDAGATVMALVEDISQRVANSMDVLIERMVIDSKAVRLSGTTDNYNTVDGLKGVLQQSPHFDRITISSADLDRVTKRVQFDMQLTRKPPVADETG
jgi:general secretion pathway protein L